MTILNGLRTSHKNKTRNFKFFLFLVRTTDIYVFVPLGFVVELREAAYRRLCCTETFKFPRTTLNPLSLFVRVFVFPGPADKNAFNVFFFFS